MNRLLDVYLKRLFKEGQVRVTYASGAVRHYGDGSGAPFHARFNHSRAEWAIALNPALKLGESYMDGDLDIVEGTAFDLIRLISVNAGRLGAFEPWMRAVERMRLGYRRLIQNNTRPRASRNVRHHYDLSDELYALFLDADRQYSCAYFEHPGQSLDDAQLAKKRHLAAKLVFDRPGLQTLDIGCGWGGLGLYLADHCEATVSGVTLSAEQQTIAAARAEAAGLGNRASFALQDYRDCRGPFDRIVSVGMFEHVGPDFYDTFFERCRDMLAEDGVMLLHTIGRFQPPKNTNSFLAKYIFPGGYIPSLSEIMPAAERAGFIVADIEVLRLHYAETCRHWRERFAARRADAERLAGERFCRMWEFYLAASEGSFRWQDLVVFQLQLVRRHGVVPTTRDYIALKEAELRGREADAIRSAEPDRHAAE